jgi:hypothetical protein
VSCVVAGGVVHATRRQVKATGRETNRIQMARAADFCRCAAELEISRLAARRSHARPIMSMRIWITTVFTRCPSEPAGNDDDYRDV